MRVSFNGQQFSPLHEADALRLTYYAPPIVSAIAPSIGPRAGASAVVLHGANFPRGSHTLVSFGGVAVEASAGATDAELRCATPHSDAPATVPVRAHLAPARRSSSIADTCASEM